MDESRIIAAVDVGTRKVVVLIGQVFSGHSLHIIGKGQSTSQGMLKGEIVDIEKMCHCVHAALNSAEQSSGVKVGQDDVYLSIAGAHLIGRTNEAQIKVSSSSNIVSKNDIERLHHEAKAKELPEDFSYLLHVQNPIYLDGKMIDNPLGREGEILQMSYWSIAGENIKLRNLMNTVNTYMLRVRDVIPSSLADGAILTDEADKAQGVLVIDVGAGTTDYILYDHGYVVHTGSLPIGGDHLTNDLSIGLRVSPKGIEKVKREFGKAIIDRADRMETIMLFGDYSIGDKKIRKHAINQIISARIGEIFQLIKADLGSKFSPEKTKSGVLLTGGTSQLSHICERAEEVFECKAGLAQLPEWVDNELRIPEYTTALGIINYAMLDDEKNRPKKKKGGLLGRVAQAADRLFNL